MSLSSAQPALLSRGHSIDENDLSPCKLQHHFRKATNYGLFSPYFIIEAHLSCVLVVPIHPRSGWAAPTLRLSTVPMRFRRVAASSRSSRSQRSSRHIEAEDIGIHLQLP